MKNYIKHQLSRRAESPAISQPDATRRGTNMPTLLKTLIVVLLLSGAIQEMSEIKYFLGKIN